VKNKTMTNTSEDDGYDPRFDAVLRDLLHVVRLPEDSIAHIGNMEMIDFVHGRLSAEEADQVRRHADTCPLCADALREEMEIHATVETFYAEEKVRRPDAMPGARPRRQFAVASLMTAAVAIVCLLFLEVHHGTGSLISRLPFGTHGRTPQPPNTQPKEAHNVPPKPGTASLKPEEITDGSSVRVAQEQLTDSHGPVPVSVQRMLSSSVWTLPGAPASGTAGPNSGPPLAISLPEGPVFAGPPVLGLSLPPDAERKKCQLTYWPLRATSAETATVGTSLTLDPLHPLANLSVKVVSGPAPRLMFHNSLAPGDYLCQIAASEGAATSAPVRFTVVPPSCADSDIVLGLECARLGDTARAKSHFTELLNRMTAAHNVAGISLARSLLHRLDGIRAHGSVAGE
jgi:hypothetical protein